MVATSYSPKGNKIRLNPAAKPSPVANYPGEGFAHMTKAKWDSIYRDSKRTVTVGSGVINPYERKFSAPVATDSGIHRQRVLTTEVFGVMTLHPVFILDCKVVLPPSPLYRVELAPTITANEEITA